MFSVWTLQYWNSLLFTYASSAHIIEMVALHRDQERSSERACYACTDVSEIFLMVNCYYTWVGSSTLCVGIVVEISVENRSQNVCVVPLPTLRIMLVQLLFECGCLLAFSRCFCSSNCWCLRAQCVLQWSDEVCELFC